MFVSTGGEPLRPGADYARELIDHGIKEIELSGGTFRDDALADLVELRERATFRLHNYFPPPEEPFVLNLASADDEVRRRSVEHVVTALRWSHELESPVYGVHAGFLVESRPSELGGPLSPRDIQARDAAIERFLRSLQALCREAAPLGVELLVENNVVSPHHLQVFGESPFLMTGPEECRTVLDAAAGEVFLLLDVGHARVAGHTEGFDAATMLRELADVTRGYHLSENSAIIDTNEPVRSESWFWPYLAPNVTYRVLEVYGLSPAELADQVRIARAALHPDLSSPSKDP